MASGLGSRLAGCSCGRLGRGLGCELDLESRALGVSLDPCQRVGVASQLDDELHRLAVRHELSALDDGLEMAGQKRVAIVAQRYLGSGHAVLEHATLLDGLDSDFFR